MDVGLWLRRHGADGILKPCDIESLRSAQMRVLDLMSDHAWHSADEIRAAAGGDGPPQSEGLRRMRALRPMLAKVGSEIQRMRHGESRLWLYRITEPKPQHKQQAVLFE